MKDSVVSTCQRLIGFTTEPTNQIKGQDIASTSTYRAFALDTNTGWWNEAMQHAETTRFRQGRFFTKSFHGSPGDRLENV